MGLDPNSRVRFDLSKASILVLDPTPMGMSIMVQILTGLGGKLIYRCGTIDEAKEAASHHELHLLIVDGSMSQTGEGYEFVRWLRSEAPERNLYAPVLLTSAHTRIADVTTARDCGGHFIVAKPIAPIILLERIIWVAKEGRGFILSDNYVGPDRRFRDDGPPPTRIGLRREDRISPKPVAESAQADEAGSDQNPSFVKGET